MTFQEGWAQLGSGMRCLSESICSGWFDSRHRLGPAPDTGAPRDQVPAPGASVAGQEERAEPLCADKIQGEAGDTSRFIWERLSSQKPRAQLTVCGRLSLLVFKVPTNIRIHLKGPGVVEWTLTEKLSVLFRYAPDAVLHSLFRCWYITVCYYSSGTFSLLSGNYNPRFYRVQL